MSFGKYSKSATGMSRSAFLFSLALHAVVLLLVGKWLASQAGPGAPGTGVTFSSAAGGGLLCEIGDITSNIPIGLPLPPEFTPPAPTLETPPPPVEALTAQATSITAPPALSPIASREKTAAQKSARTAARGSQASGKARGSGTGGEGAGVAGTGGGPGYVPPQFRLRYKPAYPEEARARRLEGTVLLLVSLDARGRVTAAALQRTCGHDILDRAALKAVRSWLFDPARQNGTAIAAQVEIPIRFRFEDRA